MVLSYDAYTDSKNELEEMHKIKGAEEINADAISNLSEQIIGLTEEIEMLKNSKAQS